MYIIIVSARGISRKDICFTIFELYHSEMYKLYFKNIIDLDVGITRKNKMNPNILRFTLSIFVFYFMIDFLENMSNLKFFVDNIHFFF